MKRENKIKSTVNDLDSYLLTQEEYMTRHYQDNIGIPTHSDTRITQGVESGNYVSRTRI